MRVLRLSLLTWTLSRHSPIQAAFLTTSKTSFHASLGYRGEKLAPKTPSLPIYDSSGKHDGRGNIMLFSSLLTKQNDETLDQNDDTALTRSLAASYLVDISLSLSAKDWETTWSLIPIDKVIKHTNDDLEAVGAQAISALQASKIVVDSSKPEVVLQCKRSEEDRKNIVHVTRQGNVQEEDTSELLSVLSRLMVQQYMAILPTDTQQIKQDSLCTIKILDEEPIVMESMSGESDVLKLFAPLVGDSKEVEIVEMVRQDGSSLGMVPRPLVHKFNLLHRGIGMVITKNVPIVSRATDGSNQHPDLYCHRRTDTKRIFPSLYDMFVGGVSSAGEDAFTTASREVAEELGLSRALTEDNPLSQPLFDCTVCTSYNRCVVTVFCYTMDTTKETVSWQPEEVVWGDFVPYAIVEAAAELSIQRLVASKKWPGSPPKNIVPSSERREMLNNNLGYEKEDWASWDFVPDGLLVWEAWLQWQNNG